MYWSSTAGRVEIYALDSQEWRNLPQFLAVGSIGRFHEAIFHDFMIHEGMLLPIAGNFCDAPSLDMASLLQPMQGPKVKILPDLQCSISRVFSCKGWQLWTMSGSVCDKTLHGEDPAWGDTKFNTILGESFGFFKSHVCFDNCCGSKILRTNIYLASAEHLA